MAGSFCGLWHDAYGGSWRLFDSLATRREVVVHTRLISRTLRQRWHAFVRSSRSLCGSRPLESAASQYGSRSAHRCGQGRWRGECCRQHLPDALGAAAIPLWRGSCCALGDEVPQRSFGCGGGGRYRPHEGMCRAARLVGQRTSVSPEARSIATSRFEAFAHSNFVLPVIRRATR